MNKDKLCYSNIICRSRSHDHESNKWWNNFGHILCPTAWKKKTLSEVVNDMKRVNYLRENWYALLIAIVKEFSPGKALIQMRLMNESEKVSTTKKVTKVPYKIFPNQDIERMIELKKTMSYKQVGMIFQTTDHNIYYHIKRYRPDLIKSGVFGYNKARTGKNSYLTSSSDIRMAQ